MFIDILFLFSFFYLKFDFACVYIDDKAKLIWMQKCFLF